MIRPWHRKLARDTLKAALPFQAQLRALKRRIAPYQTVPSVDLHLLNNGLQQIRLLRQSGVQITGKTVLELGSGWHPIIPTLLFLAGAERVILTDQEKLLDLGLLRSAMRFVLEQKVTICEALELDPDDMAERLRTPPTRFTEGLEQLGFQYIVPYRTTMSADASVDIVLSRAVLEHIPPEALQGIVADFMRMLRPAGAMCHLIDNSDHWSHADKSISAVNFLRYGDVFWRLTCLNAQNYQNRLRHSDYAAMLVAAGFEIVNEVADVDPRCVEALATLPLAPRFRDRSFEDLATRTSIFVGRKPAQ